MTQYIIDGSKFNSTSGFHEVVRELFDFGQYYGANPDALRDFLSTELERPLEIVWIYADRSKDFMGKDFDKLVGIFNYFVETEKDKPKKFLFRIEW